GHTGQASAAALSQTVNTKSSCGAPGLLNSCQLFERKPLTSKFSLRRSSSAFGCTAPFGWLPAEKAQNFPPPSRFMMASAMIERAEFPVHRNKTFLMRGVVSVMSYLARLRDLDGGSSQPHSEFFGAMKPQSSGCWLQQSLTRYDRRARMPSMSAR